MRFSVDVQRAGLCWGTAFLLYLGGLVTHDVGLTAIWPNLMVAGAALWGAGCMFIGYHRGYGDGLAQAWDELRDESDLDWPDWARLDEQDHR